MKTDKVRFYTERGSFGIQATVILMSLSAVFRVIGCWGMWNDRSYAITQIALPVISALLLAVCVWLLGKHALWLSFIPVTLGAVFFIVKAMNFDSQLHMILCVLLYIAVIALYGCTVFGIIRTKWILVLLFGIPFLYHIFVEDLPALRDTANPVSFASGMQEMGVLCIMLGLFFLSVSMKKAETAPRSTWLKTASLKGSGRRKAKSQTESPEATGESPEAGIEEKPESAPHTALESTPAGPVPTQNTPGDAENEAESGGRCPS